MNQDHAHNSGDKINEPDEKLKNQMNLQLLIVGNEFSEDKSFLRISYGLLKHESSSLKRGGKKKLNLEIISHLISCDSPPTLGTR